MNERLFQIKNNIFKFIFVTIIYKSLRLVYCTTLYHIHERIYRFFTFIFSDDKKEYDSVIKAECEKYKDDRIFWHSMCTLADMIIVLIVIIIINGRR